MILKKAKHNIQKSNLRYKQKVENMRIQLVGLQSETKKLSTHALNDILNNNNINESQQTLIREILNSCLVKPTNRRYSENWILLCILLHIRSSSIYNFLRDQGILPLPCSRTIRNYLAMVKSDCGFDEKFFKLFKTKMSLLSDTEKHGVLIFDEIFLRESISVDTKTLTYCGLEDFGKDNSNLNSGQKADHGLVMMFQSLGSNITQPIAVFASKGPVKGVVLSQLVVKAITLLENAGAKIDGVVSDGSSTNRRLWSEFGVSGKMGKLKNFIVHPMNENRKIYFFSDAPHLIKTVRNMLYNNKMLRISDKHNYIKWDHYVQLHEQDLKQISKRVCPKITNRHLVLDSFSKMNVKLATQVLEEAMIFIDQWESNMLNNKINESDFLTKQTAEGLRVTIQSTIDLTTYLLDIGFHYVLTNKMNQDKLEIFFGSVRQATGPNDHPSTPTFLQVYKILSAYSILKPPKSGNCTILETATPKISLNDIKEVFNANESLRFKKLQNLTSRLDEIVNTGMWEADDILDHDYCKSSVKECITYYICGYVSRKLSNHTKCNNCKMAILKGNSSTISQATLTNMKSKGGLIHPNQGFYNLILAIEDSFEKHCNSEDVFENCVDDVLVGSGHLTEFPCSEHKSEIMTYIISYYITMRMRQHTALQNRELKKKSCLLKKKSKLVKH
ncbi:unnamed protein product [Macrosiphum euphorbiae]|uniref:Transposase n=1 Tax=Macrosiphum euphorbiae TaxID=13131 RepID=A0AAV0WU32_9HEMI|nr:unnamed protein product [Macrosiphum euphorbiae]